jgi:hypothetical protein
MSSVFGERVVHWPKLGSRKENKSPLSNQTIRVAQFRQARKQP